MIAYISTYSVTHVEPDHKIILGVDLDSTLAKIDQPWLDRLNRRFDKRYRDTDWTDWNFEFLSPAERDEMFILFTPDIYESAQAYPFAPEAIAKLAGISGLELKCVTSSPSQNESAFIQAKHKWIKRHIPELSDSILFTNKKSGIGLTVLVDDAPHHFQGSDFIPILVERPWNKNVTCDLRFSDWSSGYSLILQLIQSISKNHARHQ